ncbi:MAG: MBOAT family protein, partial [Planctomycetota bacterium]|nr:MBOAT family protein [Planctomycetota bacterium]
GLLFLIGFFKKACVADNLAMLVDPYFASPATHSSLDAWSAMLLFTTQLYCDFSGYSDMAVASAGFLGFRLPRNFDYPYLRPNITVAWRAWHMTMTTWFRDYVYAPLRGSRGGSFARARNVIVTMIIVGLWHGAHGRFLVWGAIHGLALVTHATWARGRAPGGRAKVATSTLVTFLYVCLTMVVFRADDLGTAWTVWSQVLGQGGAAASVFGPGPLLVFTGLALVHVAARARLLTPLLVRLPAPAYSALCGLFVALILATMKTDVRPFVYFEF